MATKPDTLAAKQRRQKMFLVVGGVLLAGLVAFQAPKVLNRGSSSAKSASPTTSSTGTTTPASTYAPSTGVVAPGGASAPVAPHAGGASAKLAGILLTSPAQPTPAKGQLWSFSRFKVKDPFMPRVIDTTSSSTAAPSGTAAPAGKPATGVAVPSGPLSPGGLIVPTKPGAAALFGYATILVNGKPQQLQLKQFFPKGDPTFVLRGVGKRFVTIGVAGGKFTDGSVVKVQLGREVTLLNTTTGQRYVIKVVYVGAQPEAIASFRAAPSRTTASKAP